MEISFTQVQTHGNIVNDMNQERCWSAAFLSSVN